MSDIVARLRAWRELHLTRLGALFDEAADEVERLRNQNGAGSVLVAPECPYVTGRTTLYCTLTTFTLTDAEREAVEYVVVRGHVAGQEDAATLRGLLERLNDAT